MDKILQILPFVLVLGLSVAIIILYFELHKAKRKIRYWFAMYEEERNRAKRWMRLYWGIYPYGAEATPLYADDKILVSSENR